MYNILLSRTNREPALARHVMTRDRFVGRGLQAGIGLEGLDRTGMRHTGERMGENELGNRKLMPFDVCGTPPNDLR
jgi:hypothetical protein